MIRPDEFSAAAITAITTVTATTPDLVLGAAVLDRKTGVDVLTRRHAGLAVSDRDVMLIGQALGPSADEAMNVLWTRFDGLGAVERVAQGLGLAHTQPPADPSRWGETLTSARDTIVLYRHVLDIMPPADRDLIMDGIATAPPIANDGFDLLSTQPRDVGYDQATATLTAAADAAQAALLNNRLAPRAPTSPGPTV